MLASAFNALGPTALVGTSAIQVQVSSTPGGSATSFRVRCLVAAYLTWGQGSGVTAVGAPSAGVPSANTIGMTIGQVETFTFPANSYFISSVAAAFEVTPGEGV